MVVSSQPSVCGQHGTEFPLCDFCVISLSLASGHSPDEGIWWIFKQRKQEAAFLRLGDRLVASYRT